MSVRLSVDIGGTFTDVVLDTGSARATTKILTTYDDPARGVIDGVKEVLANAGVAPEEISLVLHGTTLATNALIERRGAVTGLLTTQGHRDILEMAFENRFEQYDVNIDRPAPLVPRYLRVGVAERMAADGETLLDLDEQQARQAIQKLLDQGVTSIAIGLLHAYANDRHEARLAEIVREMQADVSLSLSSQVCPEIREYERLSTTVANAYVQPLMDRYLQSLQTRIQDIGIDARILLMTSGGGLTTLDAARRFPIRLVESGPAGGAILASATAVEQGMDQVLSFDMGGTTAKICLIDKGEPQHSRAFEVDRSYRFKKGSGLPVRIPVVEMVEIGAGGGSIARVDALARVQVGPESASSEPGPACYGLGGEHATVTDADAVLGKLAADFFAGGKFDLDVPAAERALERHLADVAEPAADAARVVAEIVDENMAAAARAHASEWGRTLSGRCLMAFGGAAPLHAANLARKLKIDRVLVPAGAGVGSAIGFLLAPVRFEVVRSHVCLVEDLDPVRIKDLLDDMRAEASEVLDASRQSGDRLETVHAYMRYQGQGYEIAVPADGELANLEEAFSAEYARLYGRTIPNMPVEILSWTLSLAIATPAAAAHTEDSAGASRAEPIAHRPWAAGARDKVPLYKRADLEAGDSYDGPMLVVEDQTTTVVPDDARLSVLSGGHLLMEFNHD